MTQFSGDDAESGRSATGIYLAGGAIDIVAAALAILYVRRVTRSAAPTRRAARGGR
jgi:hypothetical protein